MFDSKFLTLHYFFASINLPYWSFDLLSAFKLRLSTSRYTFCWVVYMLFLFSHFCTLLIVFDEV